MRFDFIEIPEKDKAAQQQKLNAVTRTIAIAVAFASVFLFFFKLLFF